MGDTARTWFAPMVTLTASLPVLSGVEWSAVLPHDTAVLQWSER